MKVLLVSDLYRPMIGGVPSVVSALAAGLSDRGHLVHVLAPASPAVAAEPAGTPAIEHLVPSVSWPFHPGLRLATRPGAVRALLRQVEPDVVHLHSPLVLGMQAVKAASTAGVAVVATNHYLPVNAVPRLAPGSRGERVLATGFYRHLLRVYQSCDLVTAPTQAALGLLHARGLCTASAVVSNGVDVSRFKPGPPDGHLRERLRLDTGRPQILSLMRLSREKRIDLLIDAMPYLPHAHLAIAGSGPDEHRLRRRVDRLGLGRSVTLLGHVPDADLPGFYRLGDVFAVASPAELQSLAAMEALASGVPVVGARAGALPELLAPGGLESGGRLFPPGDERAVAVALADVLANRSRYAAAARRAMLRHDLKRVLSRWEQLYGELLRSGPTETMEVAPS